MVSLIEPGLSAAQLAEYRGGVRGGLLALAALADDLELRLLAAESAVTDEAHAFDLQDWLHDLSAEFALAFPEHRLSVEPAVLKATVTGDPER